MAYFSLIVVMILLLIFYGLNKQSHRLIKYGTLKKSHYQSIEGRQYYIELVKFDDYHQALHHYFHIVADIQKNANMQSSQYDFLDWTNAMMHFNEYSIHLVRQINEIKLIKSHNAISKQQFENDLIILSKTI